MSVFKSALKSLAVTVAVLSVMTSCGSSRKVTVASTGKSHGGDKYRPVEYVSIDPSHNQHEQALLAEAKKWLGTPYKYGGEDRNGIDCSALVLNVFRDALDIKLPRSSRQQFDYTQEVSRKDLIPGDLVFFATNRGSKAVSHVGLYIGENKMVHSSASKGVMVSGLSEDYFVRTFVGAGRIAPYYAMIENKKKGKKKNEKEEIEPVEEIVPDKDPFRFEPVASIPTRKTPVTAPEPVKQEPTVTIAAVTPATSAATPEISAEEARRNVLNSLIEQKLDSIYSSVE